MNMPSTPERPGGQQQSPPSSPSPPHDNSPPLDITTIDPALRGPPAGQSDPKTPVSRKRKQDYKAFAEREARRLKLDDVAAAETVAFALCDTPERQIRMYALAHKHGQDVRASKAGNLFTIPTKLDKRMNMFSFLAITSPSISAYLANSTPAKAVLAHIESLGSSVGYTTDIDDDDHQRIVCKRRVGRLCTAWRSDVKAAVKASVGPLDNAKMDALDILTLAKNILDLGEGIREVTVTAEFVARVAILRSVFVEKRTVQDSDVKAYWEEVDNRLADIRKDKTSSEISRIIYRTLRVDIDFYGNGGKDINVAAMPSAPSSMFE